METNNGATSGVMRCLTALDIYAANADGALAQLTGGIPQIPEIGVAPLSKIAGPPPAFPGANTLYDWAHGRGTMPVLLAKATTLTVDANDEKAQKKMFDEVDASIKATYGSDLTRLDDRVNKVYREDPARALYNLLWDLLPSGSLATWPAAFFAVPPGGGASPLSVAAKTMEKYRTCYRLDRFRLFGLVHTFLQ
ncbi:MAG: hypothetical protein WBL61_18465 [Bryobacteraceae bacterium]